jgi:hypothetical protein
MRKIIQYVSGLAVMIAVPVFASAFVEGCPAGIKGLICQIQDILNSIIPVLIALAVLYFVWGVVQYVIGNDEEAKTKGKDRIIFGLIGLAVIIGMWGLVYMIVDTFSLDEAAPDSTYFQELLPQ